MLERRRARMMANTGLAKKPTLSELSLAPRRDLEARLIADASGPDALWRSVGRPARTGVAFTVLFVVGFLGWGSLAPLAGGAVAPGLVSPDGSSKTVQHLEGGIVDRLFVRDGDAVVAGQPLLALDNAEPRAEHALLEQRRRAALAVAARLEAEQSGAEAIAFPAALDPNDPEAATVMRGQQEVFEARGRHYGARKDVLSQRVRQLDEQILGFRAQVQSVSDQLGFLTDELEAKRVLLEKGLVSRPVVLGLERARAELIGRRAELVASIAAAQQTIGETELELLSLEAERRERITSELDEVRTELADFDTRLAATGDVIERMVVSAPVSGTVINLRFKTEGGVVRPGESILDIVPSDDKLMIEARVSPTDVDVVREGLAAQIHLSAFPTRDVPQIPGVVRSISADRLEDERGGKPYFLARVEVDREELARTAPNVTLTPGMPAEVLIVTGRRTMIDYLLEPLLGTFRRGLREA